MQRIDPVGPVYYQFEMWAGASAMQHGVFTRHGGVSAAPWASLNVGGTVGDDPDAVTENIRRIFAALDVDHRSACTVWQVHSADVVVAHSPVAGRRWLARADGMVTNRPDVPLAMRFADCVPILFHDPVHHAIGIAHAGWRGTVRDVVGATVRAMQRAFDSRPEEIQAAIGPSIGPAHFQVGPEVVAAIHECYGKPAGKSTKNSYGDSNALVRYAEDGSAYVDLWETNRLALMRAGVRQIEVASISTVDHTEDFFSHRGEKGKTGRFSAVIALR